MPSSDNKMKDFTWEIYEERTMERIVEDKEINLQELAILNKSMERDHLFVEESGGYKLLRYYDNTTGTRLIKLKLCDSKRIDGCEGGKECKLY